MTLALVLALAIASLARPAPADGPAPAAADPFSKCLSATAGDKGNGVEVSATNGCPERLNVNFCVRIQDSTGNPNHRTAVSLAPGEQRSATFANAEKAKWAYRYRACRPDRTESPRGCPADCPGPVRAPPAAASAGLAKPVPLTVAGEAKACAQFDPVPADSPSTLQWGLKNVCPRSISGAWQRAGAGYRERCGVACWIADETGRAEIGPGSRRDATLEQKTVTRGDRQQQDDGPGTGPVVFFFCYWPHQPRTTGESKQPGPASQQAGVAGNASFSCN